ncbi:MAG TPA: CHASE3 domain-containing protein [Caldimonas sp.]|jgi:signal transduction histidine kinase|nr:CHASE3 domain-containing protein [Caldimonas sp.]HEX4236287.1 CHASE3 domain-containing protein [Caldimonas sp.]
MSMLSRFRGPVIAFPLAALAALAMLAISEASYQDATSSLDRLGERSVARGKLNDLVKSVLDAETGQRGYLLTGRPEYLRPYDQALRDSRALVDWLDHYFARDRSAAPTMAELAKETDSKLSELATTIAMHDRGGASDWRELVLSDIGREKMEHIRQLGETLIQHESTQVETGRRNVYQTLWLNRIGVSAMAAVSLLALFMYLRQSATLERALADEAQRVAGERDRLEQEVAARTTQLRELAQHLQTIREDERSHLARELHDELGALLTAAKLDVARLKSRLGGSPSADAAERLAHLNEALNGGIALKRRIIEDLRPSSLSNLGLVAALEILLREFATRSEIRIIDRLAAVAVSEAAQLTIYRLVQEALTNVVKYAKATEVTVTLEPSANGGAVVSVRDNGLGFDTSQPRLARHGLIGMRYRVEADGGTMRLESSPGQGTLIEATLPAAGTGPSPDSGLVAPAAAEA